jgi:hypothetical protein
LEKVKIVLENEVWRGLVWLRLNLIWVKNNAGKKQGGGWILHCSELSGFGGKTILTVHGPGLVAIGLDWLQSEFSSKIFDFRVLTS